MGAGNAYEAITEDNDPRWAFGTGFEPVVSTMDDPIPSTVDPGELTKLCLALGDDALVMSQRLQEWCTNAPELEDEVALANIGLDLLGQARFLYGRAGAVEERDEDFYAHFRDAAEFRNVTLVERPRRDFAELVARLLVFSTWRSELLRGLMDHPDPVLSAVASRGIKEIAYHREYAAGWVIRLGDGTEYSRERMLAALDAVWPYVPELGNVDVDDVLSQAGLDVPEVPSAGFAGRDGRHTAALEPLLAEMQGLARAHEGATW
jgi:ring-1,2-phenylacetyl-CoA epoxidase subunit PaaC